MASDREKIADQFITVEIIDFGGSTMKYSAIVFIVIMLPKQKS